jgi:hypothetical protein
MLKKAGKNFTKRVIATVILFILPILVELILDISFEAGLFQRKPETCISVNINE